jgi:hypothetical protein
VPEETKTEGVKLPVSLIDEDSDIGRTIEAARMTVGSHSAASLALADRARALIQAACPQYKPNPNSRAGVMCLSGFNGKPFRNDWICCSGCVASQVVQDGESTRFVGKISSAEDRLVKVIFADTQD